MALPNLADLSTCTVTATYLSFAGVPERGQVTFTPQTFIKRATGEVILIPDPLSVALDDDGHFSIELPISDDPDYLPSFVYLVSERIGGKAFRPDWYLTIDISQAGTTFDLVTALGSPVPSPAVQFIAVDGGAPAVRHSLIQVRAGTSSQWSTANPILAAREPGYDASVREIKFGDGSTHWNDLAGISSSGGSGSGSGGGLNAPVRKTDDYTAAPGDRVLADATDGEFTVSLPTSPDPGDTVAVVKIDASVNAVTVLDATRTINGDADSTLVSQWAGGTAVFDGEGWVLFAITSVAFANTSGGGGGGGGGSSVSIDFDGTLTVDGSTVELGTDAELANAIATVANTRAAADLSNVDPPTARTRLGLGTAATKNVGVTGGVASYDDARLSATAGLKVWQASTAYAAGETVLAPHGQLVRALSAFTSGTQYDPRLWLEVGAPTRDARYWPFHEWSILNLPVATTATWDVSSTGPGGRTITMRNAGVNYPWVNNTDFSVPVFYAQPTDPLATVTDTRLSTRSDKYRIPTGAAPSAGSDKAMTVIEPTGRFADETWLSTKVSDTAWTCGRHEHIDLWGDGTGPTNGIHASGSSLLGGHIRYVDYLAGVIPHALTFGIDGSSLYHAGSGSSTDQDYGYSTAGVTGYQWPATEQDFNSASVYGTDPAVCLPMGQAIGIPPWIDVEALPIGAPGLMIARALQRYGGFICDRTTNTFGCTAEPSIPSSWVNQARVDIQAIQQVMTCMTNSTQATPNGGELLADGSNRVWRMAPPLPASKPMEP